VASWAIVASYIQNDAITAWAQRRRLGAEVACLTPNKDGHRRFGNVRKRDSGRFQARYPGPDGRMHTAPETFARKSDAERYLTLIEAQIVNGDWTDPERTKV
jgi:hypothetical protein